MTTSQSTKSLFDVKLARLEKLTTFVAKLNEATLGEVPQMRTEYAKLKKIALKEMAILNQELRNIAQNPQSKYQDIV